MYSKGLNTVTLDSAVLIPVLMPTVKAPDKIIKMGAINVMDK